jgi:hypothetical protein
MDVQKSMGYPLNYYNERYVENFMKLMFEIPTGPYKASPVVIEAIKLFILHVQIKIVLHYGKNGRFSCRFIRVNIFRVSDLYTEEQTRRFLKEEIHQNGGMPINIWQSQRKTILLE